MHFVNRWITQIQRQKANNNNNNNKEWTERKRYLILLAIEVDGELLVDGRRALLGARQQVQRQAAVLQVREAVVRANQQHRGLREALGSVGENLVALVCGQ
jgi:hypothetical protein